MDMRIQQSGVAFAPEYSVKRCLTVPEIMQEEFTNLRENKLDPQKFLEPSFLKQNLLRNIMASEKGDAHLINRETSLLEKIRKKGNKPSETGLSLYDAYVIDNVVKGQAGNALQNMNIMMGIEETTGLMYPGRFP